MTSTYIISPENTNLSASTYNILVYLEKEFDDIGFYSASDGGIIQEDTRCNFTYTIEDTYVSVFNSVDKFSFTALSEVIFLINWGDGSPEESITIEQVKVHQYGIIGSYQITLRQESPWADSIKKTIKLGEDLTIENPLGTIELHIPYSNNTFEQNFIDLSDAECQDLEQDGIIVSGFTKSRLKELMKYGQTKLTEGLDADGNGVIVSGITDSYTAYTIDNIFYTDFTDGLTFYSLDVGDDPQEYICQLVIKEDGLMGVVSDIEITSDVYIERGKSSVFEKNVRLCEIDSVGELDIYGNGYFNIKKTS